MYIYKTIKNFIKKIYRYLLSGNSVLDLSSIYEDKENTDIFLIAKQQIPQFESLYTNMILNENEKKIFTESFSSVSVYYDDYYTDEDHVNENYYVIATIDRNYNISKSNGFLIKNASAIFLSISNLGYDAGDFKGTSKYDIYVNGEYYSTPTNVIDKHVVDGSLFPGAEVYLSSNSNKDYYIEIRNSSFEGYATFGGTELKILNFSYYRIEKNKDEEVELVIFDKY